MTFNDQLLQESVILPQSFEQHAGIFTDQLLAWNKVHNMTGYKTAEEIATYIVDSLIPISFLPPVHSVLDIGTGAGFPGLILAMALHNTHFDLVEPLAKRASFLQYIASLCNLKNVTVHKKRIEQMTPKAYDLITSRAVTETASLLEMSRLFQDKKTLKLFYKGEQVFHEAEALNEEYEIITRQKRHYLLIGTA